MFDYIIHSLYTVLPIIQSFERLAAFHPELLRWRIGERSLDIEGTGEKPRADLKTDLRRATQR